MPEKTNFGVVYIEGGLEKAFWRIDLTIRHLVIKINHISLISLKIIPV